MHSGGANQYLIRRPFSADSSGGAPTRAAPRRWSGRPLYPALGFRLSTGSFEEMRPPAFSAEEAAWCLDQYLNCPSEVRDVRASPALAGDLSGLPPAYIVTAEYDGLRDDGEAYALSLARAGVAVQLRRYLQVTHGFLSMPPSYGSCPTAWCMSRESWSGWTRAQLTTADNRAG